MWVGCVAIGLDNWCKFKLVSIRDKSFGFELGWTSGPVEWWKLGCGVFKMSRPNVDGLAKDYMGWWCFVRCMYECVDVKPNYVDGRVVSIDAGVRLAKLGL